MCLTVSSAVKPHLIIAELVCVNLGQWVDDSVKALAKVLGCATSGTINDWCCDGLRQSLSDTCVVNF